MQMLIKYARNLALLSILMSVLLAGSYMIGRMVGQSYAQRTVEPSCDMCQAELVPLEEIQRYVQIGQSEAVGDMQIRSIDVGRTQVQVSLVHRNALAERANRVAEHSLVTEVYYMLSGGGTVLTGPELIDPVPRAADSYNVTNLNGPGHNAADVRNGVTTDLEAGDVFVIPAGTGHEFIEIPDHVTYITFRIDPDKVVALMNAEDSAAFLEERL